MNQRMKPERTGEKVLEDHHVMVTSREMRRLVAEDRYHFVPARTPGPSRRQQHIVTDDAHRDRGGDFPALQ